MSAAVFMALAVLGFFLAVFGFESIALQVERPYLIPWVLATGAVNCIPLIYVYRQGDFSLVHPLVFPVLVYFFPMFFIGGWSLVFGLSNYYFLSFVNNPEWDFPLAFFYIMLGFTGLSAGFLLPFGKRIGNYLSTWLPNGISSRSR